MYASWGRWVLNPATGKPGRFAMVRTPPAAGEAKKLARRNSGAKRARRVFLPGLLANLGKVINLY